MRFADPVALSGEDDRKRVAAFLDRFGTEISYLPPDHTLLYSGTITDPAGGRHLHYRLWWRGLPVEGGELRFHFDPRNRLTAVNGFLLPTEHVSLLPDLPPQRAIALAQRYFTQVRKLPDASVRATSQPELMLFRTGLLRRRPGHNHLAYAVTVEDVHGDGARLFIDAHTGARLADLPTTYAALDRRLYKNGTFNPTNNLLWQEGDPFPGSLTSSQQEIVTVTGQFYNFLRYTFGRDGYDGNGATMKAVSNPSSINCTSSPNANWNGNSINLCTSLVTDDVVAHEWAHALTEFTSAQVYSYQPGALNESFSDILGEVVDLINAYGDDTDAMTLRNDCSDTGTRWRIAEENTAFTPYLRDMWNPTCKADPGKTSDAEYQCGEADDGGVHSNSGVNNHAFALLVDGGTYNGVTVPAIGLTKATHLFYLVHTAYLTRYADFADQADALEAAAAQLQQAGADLNALTVGTTTLPSGEVFTAADVAAVTAAVQAVELRTAPDCPDWVPLFATDPPAVCASETPTVLFSEDFESGATGWTTAELPTHPGTWDSRTWVLSTDLPAGRMGQAFYGASPYELGDCATDLDNGIIRLISPGIMLPAGALSDAVLHFDHSVSLEYTYDGGKLLYAVNEGSWTAVPPAAFLFNGYNGTLAIDASASANPYQNEAAYTGADEGGFTCAWGTTQVDLSGLGLQPGDELRLAWDLATDGCNGWSGWWIDDVRIASCQAALPVEWLAFSAFAERQHIDLHWTTARERDNRGFTVQRWLAESDPTAWVDLNWVPGRGDTDGPTDYAFADAAAPPGRWCYYRLRQEDFDGTLDYSPIVRARREAEAGNWRILPNPVVGNDLQVWGPHGPAAGQVVAIYDAAGRLVARTVSSASGHIAVAHFPSGVYTLTVSPANAAPTVLRFIR